MSKQTHGKVGGNTANCVNSWRKITSDPWVLTSIQGITIPLLYTPFQGVEPRPIKFSVAEQNLMQQAVETLGEKHVIEKCHEEPYQFVSNIFWVPKNSGKVRIILDLSRFNEAVNKKHFKMSNIQTALQFVVPHVFMTSIDLQDAYFTFPITQCHRKFLKFRWGEQLWRFRALPMGITCAPIIFTKLITPIFAFMRKQGVQCFPYLDDSFICSESKEHCKIGTEKLAELLISLGFKVNLQKSALQPSNNLTFLGVIIDSNEMKIWLPEVKKNNVKDMCLTALQDREFSIRFVLHVIGTLNSYSVAVEYGGNHFKNLETDQIRALRKNHGDFDAPMTVSNQGKQDLLWWLNHVQSAFSPVRHDNPSYVIYADASNLGWGAVLEEEHTRHKIQGEWDSDSAELHINAKELLAVLFALQFLADHLHSCTIHIKSDNTTAIAYINKMGGVRSEQCRTVGFQIWNWCEHRHIWLTASHIPGQDNSVADSLSRNFSSSVEWELNQGIFEEICQQFGKPDIDLFASRHNAKLPRYCSWISDNYCCKVDAFSFSWNTEFLYIFPPFRLVGRCWQKIKLDRARAILVAPDWPTQSWYATILHNAKAILRFKSRKENVSTPSPKGSHLTLNNVPIIVCLY